MPTPPPPSRPAEVIDILRVEDFAADQFYLDDMKKVRLKGAGQGQPVEAMSYTAGAAVVGDRALMFNPDGSGTVIHADPTVPGYVYAGVSLGGAQMGQSVIAATEGPLQAAFWTWTFGKPIFTAPDGNLSQVPPETGYSQIVAWATGVNSIILSVEDVIALE